jgi:hypothetical protein
MPVASEAVADRARSTSTTQKIPDKPCILRPFWVEEAVSLKEASAVGGWSLSKTRTIVRSKLLGRRDGSGGAWRVSLVALQAYLNGDEPALLAYLNGDRSSDLICDLYASIGLGHLVGRSSRKGGAK